MTPEDAQKKAMQDMEQILYRDYKQFADSTSLYFAKSYFALSVNIGPQRFTYTLTPYLAKKLAQRFNFLVDLYEKSVEIIPTEEAAVSPLQMKDILPPTDEQKGPEGSDGPDGKK